MMIDHLSVFIATTFLVLIVPGPDFVLVTRNTIAGTRIRGYLTAVGICIGLIFLTVLTASGIATILARNEAMLLTLRVAGGIYLVILAVQLLRGAWNHRRMGRVIADISVVDGRRLRVRSPLVQGFLNNVLNPKALVFYLTYLPQFISPMRPMFGQTLLLGIIVVFCAAIWWVLYITAVERLSRLLEARSVRTGIDAGAGAALGTLGALVLLGYL